MLGGAGDYWRARSVRYLCSSSYGRELQGMEVQSNEGLLVRKYPGVSSSPMLGGKHG